MTSSLLYTFCLHFYLINIHIFDYPDPRLSRLHVFTEVATSLDNQGSTVHVTQTLPLTLKAICLLLLQYSPRTFCYNPSQNPQLFLPPLVKIP